MTTARVSRLEAEALVQASTTARVSRLETEALTQATATARVSQVESEVLTQSAAKARLSRLAVEVLVPNNVLLTRTSSDTVAAPTDAGGGDITFSSRYGAEAAPADDTSISVTASLARSGADSAAVTEGILSYVRALRTAGDGLTAPTDAVTFALNRFYVRVAMDSVPTPGDRVTHMTRPAAFSQPTGSQIRLKRVLPDEARSPLTKVNTWSSDTAISRPVPYSEAQPVLVDMGGFGFTTGGIVVNISQSDEEASFAPFFAPQVTS